MRAFDPERPCKILNPFTVDAGHFQIESDLFDYTHTNFGGAGTQLFETADPVIKLGLTSSIDFELVFNGYLNSATHSNQTGMLDRQWPRLRRHHHQDQNQSCRR